MASDLKNLMKMKNLKLNKLKHPARREEKDLQKIKKKNWKMASQKMLIIHAVQMHKIVLFFDKKIIFF